MMFKGSKMDFVIKLKGEFHGYYTGLYRVNKANYVTCTDDIKNKRVKKYKKRETAERHIEEIEDSSSFDSRFDNKNIICEIVKVEE